ncbi:MAG: hypothetical protein WBA76_09930 [Phormidesmis sp.]
MAQITIEVPDEFAQRLEPFQSQLPELFTRFLVRNLPDDASDAANAVGAPSVNRTYQEIINFLISQPTSQEIVDFKISSQSQQRLQALLQKNREGALGSQDRDELNLYEQLDALMGLLKAEAFSKHEPMLQN